MQGWWSALSLITSSSDMTAIRTFFSPRYQLKLYRTGIVWASFESDTKSEQFGNWNSRVSLKFFLAYLNKFFASVQQPTVYHHHVKIMKVDFSIVLSSRLQLGTTNCNIAFNCTYPSHESIIFLDSSRAAYRYKLTLLNLLSWKT